ncbi:hypothetical protein DPMN_109732 [Dreissena polymorpha]|uniref:Uncharacterized protein n=1 Tax=Dreissena polymorpha TaxID=45954 RepID=A0A9D4KAS9_DREPO|nr:hypothetical protein DPMN_109732 [Dreissena polymorpha]
MGMCDGTALSRLYARLYTCPYPGGRPPKPFASGTLAETICRVITADISISTVKKLVARRSPRRIRLC